jgi:hypothetical protein
MQILIESLAKNVSEEEIRAKLSSFARVRKVKMINVGSAPATLIDLETCEQAAALLRRINGHFCRRRRLCAWVPLWSE